MNTVKFNNTFDLFPSLFSDFETLPIPSTRERSFLPLADVSETDTEYEVHLAAAGLGKNDFNVKVDENVLIISGERKKSEKKFNLKETHYGKFVRKFTLPNEVNVDEISATYVDGILNVKVPKDVTKTKTKLIEIK